MLKKAVFGGGCFWGVEEGFAKHSGVTATRVGYAGGSMESPTYREVCSGSTGHAEVVEVEYDDEKTDYRQLLDTFFSIHDPTTRDRQGPDIGSQYRSIILYRDEQQQLEAERYVQGLSSAANTGKHVVTLVEPLSRFNEAEEYHQKYNQKHRGAV